MPIALVAPGDPIPVQEVEPVKRGRGRPPGSKNKLKHREHVVEPTTPPPTPLEAAAPPEPAAPPDPVAPPEAAAPPPVAPPPAAPPAHKPRGGKATRKVALESPPPPPPPRERKPRLPPHAQRRHRNLPEPRRAAYGGNTVRHGSPPMLRGVNTSPASSTVS